MSARGEWDAAARGRLVRRQRQRRHREYGVATEDGGSSGCGRCREDPSSELEGGGKVECCRYWNDQLPDYAIEPSWGTKVWELLRLAAGSFCRVK